MRKLLFLAIILLTIKSYGQDFELRKTPYVRSIIVYKNGETKLGFLKMNDSAFDPRFKISESEKAQKIDIDEIDIIITDPFEETPRIFQYLDNDQNRFKMFVELVYKDEISIYLRLSNDLNLFYSEFDRTTGMEMMNAMRRWGNPARISLSNGRVEMSPSSISSPIVNPSLTQTNVLPDGREIEIPGGFSGFYGFNNSFVPKLSGVGYYLFKAPENKLITIRSHKKFIKKSMSYFEDCPEFVEAFKHEEITLNDLIAFIEVYKSTCFNNEK